MEITKRRLADIVPYDANAKKHDKRQINNVAESIKQYGFVQPIVIDCDGVIVIGHCRALAAKKLGMEEVPCVCVDDLTPEQVNALRLVDNKSNESDWDFDLLADELPGLDLSAFDFDWDFQDTDETELTNEDREQEFRERMERGELSDDDEEYQEFLKKFEAKKTTDDCYTPDNIYDAVRDWVAEKYEIGSAAIVRPFYPGGDYKSEKYPFGCVVIDNPPFSIISEICEWYTSKRINFFLFAPTLTLLGIMRGSANYVACGCLGETAPRPWAAMQPYFYHDVPTTAADWQQGRCPQRRRGRIALLPPDKWCSYMEHHLRIVTEGLVEGDRWHLICVQEGVLFSYLEEPRTNVNIRHQLGAHSPELDAWIAADPESHFARFTPEQKAHPDSGHNFVFLPRIAGTED